MEQGLHQGSLLSPAFFNIYAVELMKEIKKISNMNSNIEDTLMIFVSS